MRPARLRRHGGREEREGDRAERFSPLGFSDKKKKRKKKLKKPSETRRCDMNDESRETERDGGIPFYFPPLLFNTDNMEHSFYVDDVVGQGNKCGLLTRHLLSFSRLFLFLEIFWGIGESIATGVGSSLTAGTVQAGREEGSAPSVSIYTSDLLQNFLFSLKRDILPFFPNPAI